MGSTPTQKKRQGGSQRTSPPYIQASELANSARGGDPRPPASPKPRKNCEKHTCIFRAKFPKFSESVRTHPNASERIRMHPDASERVRMHPNRSKQVQKPRKTCGGWEPFQTNSEELRTFIEIVCEVFEVFLIPCKFFKVFGLAWTCLDPFGPVRMHPDAFGCIRMHSDTFGKFWKF